MLEHRPVFRKLKIYWRGRQHMIDHYKLQVAQSELAIAACLGDGELWERAMKKLSIAIGLPWYRRNTVTH